MKIDTKEANGPQDKTDAALCASLAALVIALDEAGVLHRDRYGEILRHFRSKLPGGQTHGDAEAIIDRVIELVYRHGPELTGRYSDLAHLKRSLLKHAAAATDDNKPTDQTARRSGHAPLLGAPFVV